MNDSQIAYDERGLVPCIVQDWRTGEVLSRIPIVILTTSKDEADVLSTYDLGVSSFITKPVTFAGLVEVMRTWTRYWFEIVDLPDAAVVDAGDGRSDQGPA